MAGDYGASHWSSNKVWGRRKLKRRSKESNPYSITVKIGDIDMERIESIRAYYTEDTKGVSWENMSMLIRQIILGDYCRIDEIKKEKQKKREVEKK